MVKVKNLLKMSILLALSCGREPDNPYVAYQELPTESITAQYYKFQQKVVDTSVNSGFVSGSQAAIDVELWLYSADGNVVARFPMRWRFFHYGASAYIWGNNGNIVRMKGISGKKARDLLGGYMNVATGLATGYGQSHIKAENSKDVTLQVIMDQIGVGFQVGLSRVEVNKGITDQTHSWDSDITVVEEADF